MFCVHTSKIINNKASKKYREIIFINSSSFHTTVIIEFKCTNKFRNKILSWGEKIFARTKSDIYKNLNPKSYNILINFTILKKQAYLL